MDTYVKSDRNEYGNPKGLKTSSPVRTEKQIDKNTAEKMRSGLRAHFEPPSYKIIVEQLKRPNIRSYKGNLEGYRKAQAEYRKKRSAIVKSKGSAITPSPGGEIEKKDKGAITKSDGGSLVKTEKDDDAKNQTVDVKATTVNGDDKEKEKPRQQGPSRPGLKRNSKDREFHKDVDQSSADRRKKNLEKNLEKKQAERKEKIRGAVKTINTAASKSAKFAGGMSKAFDPKGGSSFESYIQRQTLHLME